MDDKSTRRILVTGATGYVGSNLTRRLVQLNHCVHVLVRSSSTMESLHGCERNISIHCHDGSTEGLLHILQAVRPDVVLHVASLVQGREHTQHDIDPLINCNVRLTTQLLEAMRQSDCRCLVNTGTFWQHFQNEYYNPVNLYAATKQAAIDIIRYYTEATPLRAVTLELFDTYGPNDTRKKLFAILAKASTATEPIAMSPGGQQLDLTYVDDVVDAYLVAIDYLLSIKPTTHETFSVCTGRRLRLQEVVALYEKAIGSPLRIQWGGRPYHEREVMSPWSSGQQLPGWSPKFTLERGIQRIVEATRDHPINRLVA